MVESVPGRNASITGPAKWAAVALISALAGAGLTYGLVSRGVTPIAVQRPRPVEGVAMARPRPVDLPAEPVVQPQQEPEPVTRTPTAAPMPPVVADPEPQAAQVPAPAEEPGEPAAITPKKLNLNTATQAELELLPDIGPTTAQRIIEYRRANGRFRSITDLDKVKGIGPKTLKKLAPLVTVG